MEAGEPITQLAAYDYRTAVVADRLGMDILCVSDTGGMILFGHQSTTSVSFDEVMMMSKAIDRGSQYGLRMVDMPYWSFHVSKEQAVENAGRFVHEANAEVMKCEGNRHHVPAIEAIVSAGIPVQGHIGITPMRMPQLGGFVAQGKTDAFDNGAGEVGPVGGNIQPDKRTTHLAVIMRGTFTRQVG